MVQLQMVSNIRGRLYCFFANSGTSPPPPLLFHTPLQNCNTSFTDQGPQNQPRKSPLSLCPPPHRRSRGCYRRRQTRRCTSPRMRLLLHLVQETFHFPALFFVSSCVRATCGDKCRYRAPRRLHRCTCCGSAWCRRVPATATSDFLYRG